LSRVMMLFLLICCVEHQEQASGQGRWVLGYLNGAIAGKIISQVCETCTSDRGRNLSPKHLCDLSR